MLRPSVEAIVTLPPAEHVVLGSAREGIVTAPSVKTVRPAQGGFGAAFTTRIVTSHGIMPIPAGEGIGAGASHQIVVTGAPIESI